MEDEFRLKDGMFFTVRCKVDDRRVLRLKKLVVGYVMNLYEPKPFHFHREMRQHVVDLDARELKGKRSEQGIPKSSGKSKVQQLWLAEHKKFSPGIQKTKRKQKRKSQVKSPKKSKSQKVSEANAGSETRVNKDSLVTPSEETESTKHESVHVNNESRIPTVSNGPTQRSSSSSSACKPSTLNVLRDSWSRFLIRMRSERPVRRRLPIPNLKRLLRTSDEQATSGQTGATTAAANWNPKITQSSMAQTSAAPISRLLSLPANGRIETAPAHQNIASHLATDSSGSRRSTAQHTLGTSSIDHSTSKRLHPENNSLIPAKHRRVSILDDSSGNQQVSVSIAPKYSTPEVKTPTANRNIVATDSSGSRRSTAQHTLVTPSFDRCASKRLHQENKSSIPEKHRKVPSLDGSKGNRQGLASIGQKHSTPKK